MYRILNCISIIIMLLRSQKVLIAPAAVSRKRKYSEVELIAAETLLSLRRDENPPPPLKKTRIDVSASVPVPVPAPVYVLVFDVETTGLVHATTPLEKYPYITQISMIVFDIMNRKIVRTHNHYIKLPDGVEIPKIVTEITGITREMCNERGISIIDALKVFYNEYNAVKTVIAHNIDFDRRVIMGEFHRNREHPEILTHAPNWEALHVFQFAAVTAVKKTAASPKKVGGAVSQYMPRMYCTMKNSQFLCNIRMKNGGIKYPKLLETFQYLFPDEPAPENLHNSMVDTLVCLRCFVMMRWREDISKNVESGFQQTQ